MNVYVRVAQRSFQRQATYRAATLAIIVDNTSIAVLRAYVLLAVVRVSGEIDGLDGRDAVTYAFVVQLFVTSLHALYETDIGERIKSGDIVLDLHRPVDFQLWWFAHDLGRSTFMVLTRGTAPFLVGSLVFDFRIPGDPGTWLAFAASALLAFAATFGWRFLVALSGFWMLETRGSVAVSNALFMFFSGALLPFVLLPDAVADIARALPFAAMVQLPIDVFLGERRGMAAVSAVLAVQAAWGGALLVAGRRVLARAQRKLVVQGG